MPLTWSFQITWEYQKNTKQGSTLSKKCLNFVKINKIEDCNIIEAFRLIKIYL